MDFLHAPTGRFRFKVVYAVRQHVEAPGLGAAAGTPLFLFPNNAKNINHFESPLSITGNERGAQ